MLNQEEAWRPQFSGRTLIFNINVPGPLRAGIPAAAQESPSSASKKRRLLMSGFLKAWRPLSTDYRVFMGVSENPEKRRYFEVYFPVFSRKTERPLF